MLEGEFVPGARVGRYEILERLGAGAMGEVYLGRDVTLNRNVALKALNDAHLARADLRERFAREARAVASISHPNVVQIFDIAEAGGRPYFVMEYLKGVDGSVLLARRGQLSQPEAVAIALAAAHGLSEAAAAGIIHRDVKPANLVLTERGVVKVTDFGLAKSDQIGAGLTGKGVTLGTPDYMAPEQARGGAIDTRADVYGLGCTLFHLVSGRPPFRHLDEKVGFAEVVMRHLKQPVPDLAAETGGLDPELPAICARMMAKEPAARPGYPEIVAALEGIAARVGAELPRFITAPPVLPPAMEDPLERVASKVTARQTPRSRSRPPLDDGTLPPDAPVAAAPAAPSTASGPRALPPWAIGFTVFSSLAFATALGLFLFLHPPAAAVTAPVPASDAAPATPAPSRKPSAPALPAGMILLTLRDGSEIGVSVQPVTQAQLRAVAPEVVGQLRPRAGSRVALGPSLLAARLVAQRLGGRLPSSAEWSTILASKPVQTFPVDCEWVDDGATPKARCYKGARAVVRAVDIPYRNSFFRVVRPIPR
jgi:serine/threonine-protein kinase